MQELLINGLNEYGLSLSEKQINQFEKYFEMLIEWNKVMNLTAITKYEDVQIKHFLDSISIYKLNEFSNRVNDKTHMSLIDIGTGAGFPGIPIKIMFPDLKVVLVDSLNKRVKFLNEVISNLELNDINAYHSRAEEFAHDNNYREQFDFCLSRAVANMSTLAEYCVPFVKKGGYMIAYKTVNLIEEINSAKKAIKLLGGNLIPCQSFSLPGTDIDRQFVIIEKVKLSAKKYPRGQGKPSKEPL